MRLAAYNFRSGGKKGEQNQWRKIRNDFNPDGSNIQSFHLKPSSGII